MPSISPEMSFELAANQPQELRNQKIVEHVIKWWTESHFQLREDYRQDYAYVECTSQINFMFAEIIPKIYSFKNFQCARDIAFEGQCASCVQDKWPAVLA